MSEHAHDVEASRADHEGHDRGRVLGIRCPACEPSSYLGRHRRVVLDLEPFNVDNALEGARAIARAGMTVDEAVARIRANLGGDRA